MLTAGLKKLRSIYYRIAYIGDSRKCPVCDFGSKRFLPYGVNPRPDAMCPFCGALERHRLIWLFLERKCDFFKNPPQSALHVAPEATLESRFRRVLGDRYRTADLFAPHVDVKMDITNIQFGEGSFDFIYCSHVLEHVPDDRKAMREFRRVLTDDGMAILLVPITAQKTIEDPTIEDPKERLRLFGQKDHVRRYGPDYFDRLQEEGFKVEKVCREDFLSSEEIERMGITRASGEIFVCRKQ